MRAFIDLAWRINASDPMWVPPLRSSVAAALDRRKHPFHQNAEVAYFLAERGDVPIGRIAAIVNERHNEFHDERTGFFGLFECADDPDAAAALIRRCAEWLKARGMHRIRGPLSFSTNEEISSPGILVEGFDTPPSLAMTHNPRFYGDLLEAVELVGCMDALAYRFEAERPIERLTRAAERIAKRASSQRLDVRPLDVRRLRQEIAVIKDIYNSAWERNWGFVPLADAELEHAAAEFRPLLDPHVCFIAEARGEPVGFSLALPNLNEVLRTIPSGRLLPFGIVRLLRGKRRVRGLRVLTLGLKPGYRNQGLAALMYLRTWQVGVARGYVYAEASWVLESNIEMRRTLEHMGARPHKRYRIYERPL